MSEGLGRRESEGRLPGEAALEKVQEEKVLTALEGSAQVLAVGWATVLASPRSAPTIRDRVVGVDGDSAVSRVAF